MKRSSQVSLNNRLPNGSVGRTAIEMIVAVSLAGLSLLALVAAFLEFRSTELASRTVFTVVSIDSALADAIGDVKNYQDPTTPLALRAGRVPPNLSFALKLRVPDAESDVVIRPNETLTLDRHLRICKTYPIEGCGYKIKLNLEQHSPAFSYSVSSAFPEAALSLDRFERNEVIIPKSAYRDPYRVACDTRREIGLMGLLSSDRYDCLQRPQQVCERGTLPKALVVNSKTHSLEFECGPASRVARCPASYALAKVNTRSLDAGAAKAVQCVRITANVAYPAKQPLPSVRLSGRACPAGYKSDSVCTLVNVKSKPGRCGAGTVQPVPGKLRFTQNQPSLGEVDCGVELQNQSCGATWEGLAQLRVKCLLDLPEFANAL